MGTHQERLNSEKAELEIMANEYNKTQTAQQEKLQEIVKRKARVDLLQELTDEELENT